MQTNKQISSFSSNFSRTFLEIGLYLQTHKYNAIRDKKPHYQKRLQRILKLEKYVNFFKYHCYNEVLEKAKIKFSQPRTRNYSVIFDVPISYEYKFPMVLKLVINRKFETKFSIVQKGSTKKDLIVNNYECQEVVK